MNEKGLIAAYSIVKNINDIKNDLLNAIRCYKEALKACCIEATPKFYALVQNNLGLAYVKLASITNAKENLLKAIEAYQEALKVRKPETNPVKYFLLKKAIGDAYYKLWLIEKNEEYLSKALDAYSVFLQIEVSGCSYIHNLYQEVLSKVRVYKERK